MYQSLPSLADAQLEAEEMLCKSCSQRIGKFHQNGVVLIVSHSNTLMDNHIGEVKRLNMDAIKAEDLQRGIQETPRCPVSCLIFA